MSHITDAEVEAEVQLTEKCQGVHELDATMRGIMEATSISEVLRQVGSIPELTVE